MNADLACPAHPGSAGLPIARRGRGLRVAGVAGGTLAAGAVAATALVPPSELPFVWPHALDAPLRLVAAALIGFAVTAAQRRTARAAQPPAMPHAQILLCISGALMMLLINDSLARAFGIAGAASLVRFRTPVDDPRDAAVMFLLIGLGMASGAGALALAAGGAVMLCAFLVCLERTGATGRRSLVVDLVACGAAFPAAHVQRVFAQHGATLEIREAWLGDDARATYLATLGADVTLDAVHADLMAPGSGLRAVSWEPARKKVL
jgi:hypothetical protein